MNLTQDNDVASRKRELQVKIEEMETTLRGLRERLRQEEENEQHEAIEHLEQYLGDIDSKYTNLHEFWQVIRSEISSLLDKRTDKHGN
ncbi:hypothetical protein ACUNV4_05010 [Granulosicoccus sp. 3-233]|uniref:hypothetical protein n=1 Tax=Granulosicoccus sp. 3-233 TaxID=3417969 RepID=UPI003D351A36